MVAIEALALIVRHVNEELPLTGEDFQKGSSVAIRTRFGTFVHGASHHPHSAWQAGPCRDW